MLPRSISQRNPRLSWPHL